MANPRGEKPGPVSILHGDDRGDMVRQESVFFESRAGCTCRSGTDVIMAFSFMFYSLPRLHFGVSCTRVTLCWLILFIRWKFIRSVNGLDGPLSLLQKGILSFSVAAITQWICAPGQSWLEGFKQRRQIHQKQEWSMEFCCSCFRVQMHKPLVHDSQRASIYHQGTEASLLELRRFMTLRGLGFPDSPNTTGWPPLVFQGLARMDQLSKSRTKNNLQAKYRTFEMPLAARHWFSEGSKSRSQ